MRSITAHSVKPRCYPTNLALSDTDYDWGRNQHLTRQGERIYSQSSDPKTNPMYG